MNINEQTVSRLSRTLGLRVFHTKLYRLFIVASEYNLTLQESVLYYLYIWGLISMYDRKNQTQYGMLSVSQGKLNSIGLDVSSLCLLYNRICKPNPWKQISSEKKRRYVLVLSIPGHQARHLVLCLKPLPKHSYHTSYRYIWVEGP